MNNYRDCVRFGNKTFEPNNIGIGKYCISIHNAFFVSFAGFLAPNLRKSPSYPFQFSGKNTKNNYAFCINFELSEGVCDGLACDKIYRL
jgi:hypothetical protein